MQLVLLRILLPIHISRYISHQRVLMMLRCLLLSFLLVSSPVLAADFDKGVRAYDAGDYTAALAEWRPLAEQGDAVAQDNLGLMYVNGQGVPRDYVEAARWFRRAAIQGYAWAQNNLGLMYGLGDGVPQDYVMAHMWSNLARARGYEEADELLELLEPNMSRQQIATAQTMARQCLAQDYKDCDKL